MFKQRQVFLALLSVVAVNAMGFSLQYKGNMKHPGKGICTQNNFQNIQNLALIVKWLDGEYKENLIYRHLLVCLFIY